jgi:hypothetical protein
LQKDARLKLLNSRSIFALYNLHNGLLCELNDMARDADPLHHGDHHVRDMAVRVREKFGNGLGKQSQALEKAFPSIDSDECYELLDAAEVRQYGKGESIITQGPGHEEVYMLKPGKATLHLDRGSSVLQVGRLKPMDTFGEAALIDNGEWI